MLLNFIAKRARKTKSSLDLNHITICELFPKEFIFFFHYFNSISHDVSFVPSQISF